METAGVRGWSRLPPTSWKKPLCAASAANWSRPEWRVAARRNKSSKWSVARKKSAATIHAPAGQARSLRNATEPNPFQRDEPGFRALGHPSAGLIEVVAAAREFGK